MIGKPPFLNGKPSVTRPDEDKSSDSDPDFIPSDDNESGKGCINFLTTLIYFLFLFFSLKSCYRYLMKKIMMTIKKMIHHQV